MEALQLDVKTEVPGLLDVLVSLIEATWASSFSRGTQVRSAQAASSQSQLDGACSGSCLVLRLAMACPLRPTMAHLMFHLRTECVVLEEFQLIV